MSQFALGKQPFGQFPPALDVGVMGMVVGERRRIEVPPALGYGSKGFKVVPPNAKLVYEVKLVAVNALFF